MSEAELIKAMTRERHRGLKVWHDAMDFARGIYEHTKSFPAEERFGLTSQLRHAAVSVPSNIAEGSKRLATDNLNFLRYALGSLAECDTQLLIAESLGYGEYTRKLKASVMSLTISIRAYAKSIKEASALLGPLIGLVLVFAIIPVFVDCTSIGFAFIPFINVCQAMSSVLKGTSSIPFIGLSILANFLYSGLMIFGIVKLFNNESIMFKA